MVAAIIIGIFIVSFLYAHSRGKEKQKVTRQLFDHSTFMGPINMFMTGFSRLPAKQPYFDEKGFPELQTLTDNWQVIREEAVRLQDHIKSAVAQRCRLQHLLQTRLEAFLSEMVQRQSPFGADAVPENRRAAQPHPVGQGGDVRRATARQPFG